MFFPFVPFFSGGKGKRMDRRGITGTILNLWNGRVMTRAHFFPQRHQGRMTTLLSLREQALRKNRVAAAVGPQPINRQVQYSVPLLTEMIVHPLLTRIGSVRLPP